MKLHKRLFSALLALAMVLSMMPVHAEVHASEILSDFAHPFSSEAIEWPQGNYEASNWQNQYSYGWDNTVTAYAANDPSVTALDIVEYMFVGGVNALATPQGDGWTFDATTATLTLSGANISGNTDFAIEAGGPLNIVLTPGTKNTITGNAFGITAVGALKISGGSLDITANGYAAVICDSSVQIENCDALNISGPLNAISAPGNVTISNSTVNARTTMPFLDAMNAGTAIPPSAIFTENSLILKDGSDLTAFGSYAAVYANQSIDIQNSAISANATIVGMSAPYVCIADSNVSTATSMSADVNNPPCDISFGICCLTADISNSHLDVQGNFYGIFAEDAAGHLYLVNCTGSVSGGYCALFSINDIQIAGSDLNISQTLPISTAINTEIAAGMGLPPSCIFLWNQGGTFRAFESTLNLTGGLTQVYANMVLLDNVTANLTNGGYSIFAANIEFLNCSNFTALSNEDVLMAYARAHGGLPINPVAVVATDSIYMENCTNFVAGNSEYSGMAAMGNTIVMVNSTVDISGKFTGLFAGQILMEHVRGTIQGTWTENDRIAAGAPGVYAIIGVNFIDLIDTALENGSVMYSNADGAYTVLDDAGKPVQIAKLIDVPAVPVGGTCGENLTWILDPNTGIMTISGNGPMSDFAKSAETPWNAYASQITSVVMEEGISHIGDSAFNGLTNMTSISIAESVTSIGSSAFVSTGLTSLYIPKNVSSIAAGTFQGAAYPFTVDAENAYFSTDAHGALFDKNKTRIIAVPSTLTGTYTVPATVTHIDDVVFSASSLTEVILPESVTNIGVYVFLFSNIQKISIYADAPQLNDCALGGVVAEITFFGDAPVFPETCFIMSGVTIYYPAHNATWIDVVTNTFDGAVTWIAVDPCVNGHSFSNYQSNNDATCTANGTMTAVCDHGCGTMDVIEDAGSMLGHTLSDWTTEGNKLHRTCADCDYTETQITTTSGTNVAIGSTEGSDVTFEVDDVVDDTDDRFVFAEEVLVENAEVERVIVNVLDITMEEQGVEAQPDSTVTVKIPVDWEKDTNYKVYYVADDGTYVDMNAYRDGDYLVFETTHFSLYVLVEEEQEIAYIPGDINGDGKVNNRDAAKLMQYLADWDIECVEAALDVNGDGKINNRDAARLMQYLAEWDVELH